MVCENGGMYVRQTAYLVYTWFHLSRLIKDMAKKASDAVRNNEIEIVPARFNKVKKRRYCYP